MIDRQAIDEYEQERSEVEAEELSIEAEESYFYRQLCEEEVFDDWGWPPC